MILFCSISFQFSFENVKRRLLTTFSFHFQNEIIFTIHCYYSLHFYYFSIFTIHSLFTILLHFYYSYIFLKFLSTFYFFPPLFTISPFLLSKRHFKMTFSKCRSPNVILKMSFSKCRAKRHFLKSVIFIFILFLKWHFHTKLARRLRSIDT